MIACRAASVLDLDQILDWAADEGWNPGLDDAKAFFSADPNGFFVAVDEKDEPIGAISVVNHTSDFAFLGLYIVCPAFRGRGIGLALWTHALEHAGARVVGLDGVEAQQDNYRTSGFIYAGSTTRFTGEVAAARHPEIHALDQTDLPILVEMEAAASGVAKPDYLRPWLTGAATRTTYVHQDASWIRGFCTIRTCRTGAKIGPLVADTDETAHHLITHAATHAEGPISLDVPETATDLAKLCGALDLTPGFKTARMYRGAFQPPTHPCWAVTSLELG